MDHGTDEIMTIADVASYLHIPLSSAYKLAHEGKIPGQKIGRHWRFYKPALIRWLSVVQTPAAQGNPPASASL